ncbi:aspartic peptidase domain-containing protein [Umbelopsis sp. PMI_123]|nr:aspartic peptidase domain-containing protein [Umbelopsis sp. PMI_123]
MRSTILCLAALAQLALTAVAENHVTIPLYRRSPSPFYEAAGKQIDDGVLAGKISVGTPPQEFNVVFDTSTGLSWIRGSKCRSENCLDRCTYYSTRSKTAVSTGHKYSVSYGDACVDTRIYMDTVTFSGRSVPNMPIGGAERMSGFDTGFDGYLGLGPNIQFNKTGKLYAGNGNLQRRQDLTTQPSSFVNAAFQIGQIESPQFGVFISTDTTVVPTTTPANPTTGTTTNGTTTNGTTTTGTTTTGTTTTGTTTIGTTTTGFVKRSSTVDSPAGYLVFGGVDKSKIEGDFNYITLADPVEGETRNWDVCLKNADFGDGLSFQQAEDTIASISTSTSYITMPCHQADKFHDKFGGKFLESTQTYTIKCSEISKMPPLKLRFDEYTVTLPASYWTREVDASRDCCETLIRKGVSNRDWSLGTAFTHAFYTSFNSEKEAVGLGVLKGSPSGLKVTKN